MSKPAERQPFLLPAGQGESVWSLGGRFTAKATAAVTEERFALVESVAFQSTEPPLHIHHREDEAWYILDGKMTFYVGDAVLEATAGCFAFAPRGIPHTFTVDVEPTRVLVFASPAGFEHFALELGEPARNDTPPAGLSVPGLEVLGPVAERYGIEVVGPPVRARLRHCLASGDAEQPVRRGARQHPSTPGCRADRRFTGVTQLKATTQRDGWVLSLLCTRGLGQLAQVFCRWPVRSLRGACGWPWNSCVPC